MFYYKQGSTYVARIMEIVDAEAISQQEYERVKAIVNQKPTPPEGYGYRLTVGLTWELYELPEEADPELTAEEALDIILGGDGI